MNALLSMFIGGENRTVLPFLLYPVILIIPTLVLSTLIVIPHDKFPSIFKQILSIPLLLAIALTPFAFTNGNKGKRFVIFFIFLFFFFKLISCLVIDLVSGVANYNFFLRFFELYWIGPFVQHRPVYTTTESLWIDFWGCIRTFPKPAKEDTQDLKKGQVKKYTKDKVRVTHIGILIKM